MDATSTLGPRGESPVRAKKKKKKEKNGKSGHQANMTVRRSLPGVRRKKSQTGTVNAFRDAYQSRGSVYPGRVVPWIHRRKEETVTLTLKWGWRGSILPVT